LAWEDEKIGGTIHVALGDSKPRWTGKNRSALHWDLVVDLRRNGRIYADDKLAMKNGRWSVW
jgi:aminopeptidase